MIFTLKYRANGTVYTREFDTYLAMMTFTQRYGVEIIAIS